MTFPRLGFICALTTFAAAAEPVGPRTHRLDPSPTTVGLGHYDAAAKAGAAHLVRDT